MPAARTIVSTETSELAGRNVEELRKLRGWKRPRLAHELARHRCGIHPEGCALSPTVIYRIESGVPGHPVTTRSMTVDELIALAHVFDVDPGELLE